MAKGAHSFSRSRSSTPSNSGGRSGQSHLSKGGKSEKTGKRSTSPNGRSERGGRSGSWSNANQVGHSSSKRSYSRHRNDASRLARSRRRRSTGTKTSEYTFNSLDHHFRRYSTDGSDASHRSESRSRRSKRRRNWRRRRNRRRSATDGSPFRSLDHHSQLDSTDGSDVSHRSESRSRRSRRRMRRRNRRRSAKRRRSTTTQNGSPFRSQDHHSQLDFTDGSDASHRSESRSSRSKRRRRRRSAKRRRRRSRARSRSHLRHQGAAPCEMPELFSCSCHPGIYCEDCFRTLRRSFRHKFERSISKRATLMLPDDGKVYMLAPSGRNMYRKLYVQLKSPHHAGTLCTAAKYPSQRHNFSDRDEEINRKLLKKLYFKHHRTRKGKKKHKHGRGT